ncbi:RecX family transcriptional regulator [Niabella ginsenosidivorans]|uniref:Regulatory protein RecX n=1 Tax=Niabella ginsenosidivorans TaxID=1176587 RepID=A0A1A9I8K8_9BACT|nr:regulatory protein RecX [Niabella ginsenosidivorans]ANH83002.1 RecX family transcriptional regulator [Niabella ginsenosidivorans]
MAYTHTFTEAQALKKLQQYCAYSERCHSDVVNKLYELGVWKKEHDAIIAALIEANYLNEERFAKAFAGGHFRQKKWGRNKIKKALQQKQVSSYCIKTAMKEIPEAAYLQVLQELFLQKWESLNHEKNRFIKMRKVSDFLLQKGFEPELIQPLFSKAKE